MHTLNSITKGKASKAKKSGKDFPLNIHKASGYWTKKVRGKCYYFGKVADDPQGTEALKEWLDVKDDLLAGREPRAKTEGLTVADICNQFLSHKAAMRDNGELSPRSFRMYYLTCSILVRNLGKARILSDLIPNDFGRLRAKLAKTLGATALRNEIGRCRSVFKFAFDEGKILHPMNLIFS